MEKNTVQDMLVLPPSDVKDVLQPLFRDANIVKLGFGMETDLLVSHS